MTVNKGSIEKVKKLTKEPGIEKQLEKNYGPTWKDKMMRGEISVINPGKQNSPKEDAEFKNLRGKTPLKGLTLTRPKSKVDIKKKQ